MLLIRRRSPQVWVILAATVLVSSLLPALASAARAKRDVLSLTAPAEVSSGQSAVLRGRLIDRSSHRPIRRVELTFYGKKPGATSWTALRTGRTDGNGYYKATVSISAAAYVAVHFHGGRGHAATWSKSKLIAVRSTPRPPSTPPPRIPPTGAPPAETIPPDGTTKWGSEGCHYTVANRIWHGDYCVAYQTDSSGKAITAVYNVYAFDNSRANNVGPILFQLDTAFPEWIVWRVPSDPEFQTVLWAAVPTSNIYAEPLLEIYLAGEWQWTTKARLEQLIIELEELLAAEGQPYIVTISGVSPATTQALTDLANGVDTLGGSTELEQAFSNVYSLGISEPFTPGVCGEVGYVCYPF